MTFYDENHPNKYRELKKLFVPMRIRDKNEDILQFWRCGDGDGSYVIPKNYLQGNTSNFLQVVSYGIGADPEGVTFEQALAEKVGVQTLKMYDGSVDEPPANINCSWEFHKEYLTPDNFLSHISDIKGDNNILKMDIEGHEYDWGTKENIDAAAEKFAVLCIEVHSLIEEVPDGWELEPQLAAAKKDEMSKILFFNRLRKNFVLWHMHANNHGPKYVDFPDSMELTFMNKRVIDVEGPRRTRFPVDGLDEPNYDGREDYVLDWWL